MIKSGSHFDVVIYGSNLSGILLSHHFAQAGFKTLLLEETEDIGRSHFSSSTENDFFRSCLEFLPDLVSSNESVLWLENLLGMSVVGSPFEQSAVTFRDGKFRDFVGFGDLKFESASDVHWYSQSKARHLKSSPQFWIKRILETKAFDVQGLSKLSQIEIVDGSVASIKVNSTKTITADLYFFASLPFTSNAFFRTKKVLQLKRGRSLPKWRVGQRSPFS